MPSPVITAYLGLGSSLGDRRQNLQDALRRLEGADGQLLVAAVSPLYESPHLGLNAGDEAKYPPHFNAVARVETVLTPEQLLDRVRTVEEAGGRQRREKWGPRTIDIDLLVYENITLTSERLTLPHPGIASRAFVVLPLADVAPHLILPDGRAVADLALSEAIRTQRITRVDADELSL